MKYLLRLLDFLLQFIHIHDWYHGHFSLGERSKHTGDLIGRSERRCVDCNRKEIAIHCFSKTTQEEIFKILGKKEFYSYKNGDWLDTYTRSKLLVNAVDQLDKPTEKDYFKIIGDGSQLMKF